MFAEFNICMAILFLSFKKKNSIIPYFLNSCVNAGAKVQAAAAQVCACVTHVVCVYKQGLDMLYLKYRMNCNLERFMSDCDCDVCAWISLDELQLRATYE